MNNISSIVDVFNSEVDNILEYVTFLEDNIITNTLSKRNINEIFDNLSSLKSNNENEIEIINDILKNFELKELPQWFKDIDVRSYEGELIEYLLEIISNEGKDDTEEIMNSVEGHLEALCIMYGDCINSDFLIRLYNDKEKLREFIELSKILNSQNCYFDYKHRLEKLINYNKALNLIDIKSNTNIYRQSFVQLIFVFDSVMFDVVRYKFNENFFEWVNYFKDDNIKLKDIGSNSDFEEFKSMVIEQQLKKCYLKDLIEIMNKKYKSIFNINSKDTYVNYREIINRRNCHIHNNGIVDKSYLGIDKNNNEPKYNIFGLKEGDYAYIDKKYFEDALNSCNELLNNITHI